jgi:benzoyl-CoA reductase subunit C
MNRLEALLYRARVIADDLEFHEVKRHQMDHPEKKILGHFQVYFPEEIAHSAGMLPIKIVGGGNKLEARRADAHLGSFICSIMRSTLELGLSKRLSFLDMLVTHPICDAARHLAGIWARTFPNQHAQILYLPQNPNSRAATTYLYHEYQRLRRDIERMTGYVSTEATLRESITLYNRNRYLLRNLYSLRKTTPWLLSAPESYAIVKAGTVLPKEKHNQLLEEILSLLPDRDAKPQDKVRVVLTGAFCELPPIEMIETMEEMCYVVDDDILIGLRWLTSDVSLQGDPLWNLASAYAQQSAWAPTQYDRHKPKEKMLEDQVRRADARGAICAAAKFCEPGVDDQIAFAKHFDRVNLPYILVEFEEKQTSFERLKMQTETFAEAILFE